MSPRKTKAKSKAEAEKEVGNGDEQIPGITEPFYELDTRGRMRFCNTAVARLFADTTAGAPEEIAKLVKEEGRLGIMRRILTDSGGVIRASILAKSLKMGLEKNDASWLRLALKIIETSIAEEATKHGRSAIIPISAGSVLEITTPIQRLLRDVDAEGENIRKGKGGKRDS